MWRSWWSAYLRISEGLFGLFLGAVLLIWNPMGWSLLRVVWVLHLLTGIAFASVLGMLSFRWGSSRCFPPVSRPERKDEAVSAGSPAKHTVHMHTLAGAIFVGLVLTMPRRLWSKSPRSFHARGPLVHFLWRWGFPALGIEVLSVWIMFLVFDPFVTDTQSPVQYGNTYDHVWVTSRALIRLSLIVLLSMSLAHIGIVPWLRT